MTGAELLLYLQQMTPEQRRSQILAHFEVGDDEHMGEPRSIHHEYDCNDEGVLRLNIEVDENDARSPWPEWAAKLLKVLEDFGAEYDADDEVNLPDELSEWLLNYASDIKRTASAPVLQKAQPEVPK